MSVDPNLKYNFISKPEQISREILLNFHFSFAPISDVTVLLSLTVFLNTVSETMPNTSDAVPLISMATADRTLY